MSSGIENASIKLQRVVGYKGRQNDVLYCHPLERSQRPTVVVYFGGDIQDLAENMQASIEKSNKKFSSTEKQNQRFVEWNLNRTAFYLSSCFPTSHIVVIRPTRIELETFSCFDNFVPSNNCGVPEYTPTHNALHHLERLLGCISDRITIDQVAGEDSTTLEDGEIVDSPQWSSRHVDLNENGIVLIGFSKGCVVLNQFIYEFHYLKTLTPEDDISNKFVSRITDMYWLDGGHAGDKNTWITSRCLLETLARLDIKIHVHVSPYQVQDSRRPWIGNEERIFCGLLKAAGGNVVETIHFEDETPTLETHFRILSVFRTPSSC